MRSNTSATTLADACVAVLDLGDDEAVVLYRLNPAAFWRQVASLAMGEAERIEAAPPRRLRYRTDAAI